jgi:hypothetical protein
MRGNRDQHHGDARGETSSEAERRLLLGAVVALLLGLIWILARTA